MDMKIIRDIKSIETKQSCRIIIFIEKKIQIGVEKIIKEKKVVISQISILKMKNIIVEEILSK